MEKRKLKYSKPELEVVSVDHVISMQAASVPESPEVPVLGAAPESNPSTNGPVNTYQTSTENNPFGSSSPFEN